MAKSRKTSDISTSRKAQPALTVEGREDQMIAMATNEAEKRIRDGTASDSLIIHYIKLGSTKMRLEKEKLRKETDLLTAKKENLESAARSEELFAKALDAMRGYRGLRDEDDI